MCTIIISAGRTPKEHDFNWYNYICTISEAAEAQGSGAAGLMGECNDIFAARKRPMPAGKFAKDTLLPARQAELLALHARSGGGYPDDREYDKNHHPFIGNNVLLMHEGFACGKQANWFGLSEELGIELDTLTDSELLMKLVDSQPNVLEGVIHAFDILDDWVIGAAIYDERTPGKMYFASNNKRCSPYHIVRSSEFHTTTLISRFSMIRDSIDESQRQKWGFKPVENVEPNTLYTFERNGDFTTEEL